MDDQIVVKYTNEGLNRLAKEKLVTIISNLQNMPAELAMKVSEHIPGFFDICSDALAGMDSAYYSALEGVKESVQRQIDIFARDISRYEKAFSEAKTDEEREKYKSWIIEAEQEIKEVEKSGEEARIKYFNTRAKHIITISALAAASIGVTIKMGKKLK